MKSYLPVRQNYTVQLLAKKRKILEGSYCSPDPYQTLGTIKETVTKPKYSYDLLKTPRAFPCPSNPHHYALVLWSPLALAVLTRIIWMFTVCTVFYYFLLNIGSGAATKHML